jgi:xanthosine utilization system XapX-like protein
MTEYLIGLVAGLFVGFILGSSWEIRKRLRLRAAPPSTQGEESK